MEPISKMDEATAQALASLTEMIKAHEVIQEYQALEENVQQNQRLNELIEQIKDKQKEAVAFSHYEKPEAEKVVIKELDELTTQFKEHFLVRTYQENLVEANALLQNIVEKIQETVNEEIQKNDDEK
ncbi:YlbF family regulator [Isobaculum melis]|uniref:Polar amino acid transport system ATP-binding protein n=1 Tax=Isobaculum melis TaxID=142588 RepID=A0A1H9RGD7_9LACT|nr:YlbF family regulator [Isobaculum melis]SER71724.1 polar amino acid transport system ATP-binding protein [Isobaculum melis]